MNKQYILVFLLSTIFTELFSQGISIPRDTSYTVAQVFRQIRKDYPFAIPAKDSLPKGLLVFKNVVYSNSAASRFGVRDLHLDVYRPDSRKLLPALIMVHGGGWRSGDKQMEVPLAQMIAKRGFVSIPVEYQLSPEAKYPAAIYNIKSAIRWLKANAETYGIDTSKIVISGTSAGGQIAALVAATNGVAAFEGNREGLKTSSVVNAVINIDGVISFLAPGSLNLNRKPDSPDILWLGGDFSEKPDVWKEASAGFWANEKMVPILFLNSGYSRFHAGQDELIASLNEWGVYYQVHKVDVKVHPFWLFHPWAEKTADYMVSFMHKIFR